MRGRLLLGCSLVLVGCADAGARDFAVTVCDSSTIECAGFADGLLADPTDLAELAKDLRKAYKDEQAASPPRPVGRHLTINELEGKMQAWFDGSSEPTVSVTVPPYDSADDTAMGTDGAPAFDDPAAVYEGDLHDDYVEGNFADLFNTDEQDEESGLLPCGLRARVRGTLSLTLQDGVAGRVRWTEITYVASAFSACEGRVECTRNITVEGLETD